jgi:competence protein ComEA
MVLGIPLDISSMSEADFDRLPGIGPALAKRIVTYRQLNGGNLRFNDLAAIEGMGEKKLELIRKFVQPAVINK